MIVIPEVIINILLIIFAVLLFEFIILSHEFGHFITAKLSGIRVNEFALGMGPRLIHFKRGETEYSLRAFPIGGFCAMEGEDESSDDPRAFGNKAVWKRILVVVAGAVMNILLGVVLMMVITGQQSVFSSTTVAEFTENSLTKQSGLRAGDEVVSINGYRVYTDRDMSFALASDQGIAQALESGDKLTVDMEVYRDGQVVALNDVEFPRYTDTDGKNYLSIDFKVYGIEKNPWTLLKMSCSYTVSTVRMVWTSLVGLLTGKYGLNDMAGPNGAAQAIAQSASQGLSVNVKTAINNILLMMTIITVNLGIVNLLPLPALDGGRLVFLLIELIFRKPVPAKYEGWVHAAGFVLLMVLMVVIAFSDVLRLVTGKGLGG